MNDKITSQRDCFGTLNVNDSVKFGLYVAFLTDVLLCFNLLPLQIMVTFKHGSARNRKRHVTNLAYERLKASLPGGSVISSGGKRFLASIIVTINRWAFDKYDRENRISPTLLF